MGYVNEATSADVQLALEAAVQAQQSWAATNKTDRAVCLKRAADLMEARIQELMVLLCRESGKTYANAIAEVREAVDFLRYYATQIENLPAHAQVKTIRYRSLYQPMELPSCNFLWSDCSSISKR